MSSIDGERSPKRQRLESYSPASPPLNHETKPFIPPNTPPPSVRMSPSWQAQSAQNQHHQGGSGTFPTPPSTSSFAGHAPGRGAGSEGGGDSGHQTPVTDADSEMRRDGDGDADMKDQQEGGEVDVSMADAEHRRSNHERQGASADGAMSSIPGAQPLYKLSTTPIPPARPQPSQDFIKLYGLSRIQGSVARRDPITGDKINKLRKSYENKLKALNLEGRNKATANEFELWGFLDPLWDMEWEGGASRWDAEVKAKGKQLGNANAEGELLSKMGAALSMQPGRLPDKEHKTWQTSLGLDDATTAARVMGAKVPPGAPNAVSKTAPAAQARSSAPASPRNMPGRPERTGKKRRYNDSSYEGYQEGYDDDGYSTGGMDDTGRRGSNAKRQKRKVSIKPPGYFAKQQQEAMGLEY